MGNVTIIAEHSKALTTSVFSLSYLGDACYELWCRQYVLSRSQNSAYAHQQVVSLVRCEAQARLVQLIIPNLTMEEQRTFRRGKNYRQPACPKHATMREYRAATGFECLLGYWFLEKQMDRFEQIMAQHDIQQLFKEILDSSNLQPKKSICP